MQVKTQYKDFHHALKVVNDVCIGCTHCMSACPTQAIRVRGGKATIIDNRCVDCGECYKVCPVSAFIVEQDDLQMIYNYPVRVVLLPGVLIGQFPEKIETSRIYEALKEIGFTHIYEVENSVEMVLDAYQQYQAENSIRPLISSFCPAILRLIQVRFPSLVNNILRAKPPIDLSALYYKKILQSEGINPNDIGMFYVTPCAAKIAAVKSPVGEEESPVNGVINMKFLYNRILQHLKKNEETETGPDFDRLQSARSILWTLTRGESNHFGRRALAIDGIRNVTEFLERLENDEFKDIDFLELRACDESCAGGILISGNRFLTVERLNNRAADSGNFETPNSMKPLNSLMDIGPECFFEKVKPRPIEKLDEDISRALRKMERKRRLMCFLPGFDCAACGAPTCQTLAEDIVQGRAQVSHCIFMQQMMIEQKKLSLEHAKKITESIWGSERLQKNCNKLGAEDENN
jgi:Na+-translocating ferredoxin:NAD+ oxidoreductase RNF subunit RnfB